MGGFGNFLSKAFAKVKSIASDTIKTVKKSGKSVIQSAVPVVKSVYNEAKSAVTTIYKDAKSLAEKPIEMIEHNVQTLSNLGSNVAKDFAWPIGIGLGAIGIAYVLTK